MMRNIRVAIVGAVLAGLLAVGCSSGASQGDDTIAESTLNGAAVSAQAIYSTTLSFAGFNAAKGKQTNPNIKWADGIRWNRPRAATVEGRESRIGHLGRGRSRDSPPSVLAAGPPAVTA
jgi:hypothetical protein